MVDFYALELRWFLLRLDIFDRSSFALICIGSHDQVIPEYRIRTV